LFKGCESKDGIKINRNMACKVLVQLFSCYLFFCCLRDVNMGDGNWNLEYVKEEFNFACWKPILRKWLIFIILLIINYIFIRFGILNKFRLKVERLIYEFSSCTTLICLWIFLLVGRLKGFLFCVEPWILGIGVYLNLGKFSSTRIFIKEPYKISKLPTNTHTIPGQGSIKDPKEL
jgi:hypothetical protein